MKALNVKALLKLGKILVKLQEKTPAQVVRGRLTRA